MHSGVEWNSLGSTRCMTARLDAPGWIWTSVGNHSNCGDDREKVSLKNVDLGSVVRGRYRICSSEMWEEKMEVNRGK